MPLGNLKTTLHRTRVFKPNTRLSLLTWKGLDPDLPFLLRPLPRRMAEGREDRWYHCSPRTSYMSPPPDSAALWSWARPFLLLTSAPPPTCPVGITQPTPWNLKREVEMEWNSQRPDITPRPTFHPGLWGWGTSHQVPYQGPGLPLGEARGYYSPPLWRHASDKRLNSTRSIWAEAWAGCIIKWQGVSRPHGPGRADFIIPSTRNSLCYGKKRASLNVLEMFHLAMTPIMTSRFLLTARVFWSADSKQFSLHSPKCSGIFWVLWIGVEDRKSNPKNGGHRKTTIRNRLRTIPGSHRIFPRPPDRPGKTTPCESAGPLLGREDTGELTGGSLAAWRSRQTTPRETALPTTLLLLAQRHLKTELIFINW